MRRSLPKVGFAFTAAGILLLASLNLIAQTGWVSTKVGPTGQDLNTVFFLDNKRGWVGGDNGFVSYTDDGGHSWVQQTVETKDAINDIYFRDKEAGFLIAGSAIFGTRDNGTRWTELRRFRPGEFNGAEVELYSVRFPSKKKGWVVGSVSRGDVVIDSILLYTDDAGETWQRKRAPSKLELIHLEFANDKRGWIVGDDGTILATTDAGDTWTKQESGTTATLYHVDFRNDKKGLAVGGGGTVLRTTNGGITWEPVKLRTNSTLLNVKFVGDDAAFAVGRGGNILRTGDAGDTWLEQESGTKQNLYGLYFAKKTGWAVGGDGMLLRYEL